MCGTDSQQSSESRSELKCWKTIASTSALVSAYYQRGQLMDTLPLRFSEAFFIFSEWLLKNLRSPINAGQVEVN